MKIKNFDCVQIKQLGSQKIYEKIKNMSIEEELIYWREASRELVTIKDKKKNNKVHEVD
ncbi:hypothetical protein [Cyanothece sp. BG0011]|uniref:hypothetical protein n=1 Tax=Cyanothece sp. BG0011 TaxID=2082950 RepID=UPI0018E4EB91|nr:hypothetical protein [Cyanothece sp. BG0011]